MNTPESLYYTRDHEWIAVDQNVGTVGITDYAQHELGDVVFVDLPAVGAAVKASEAFGSVESVKAVSEVFSPVNGEVLEVNSQIVERPELINQEPYGKGWMIKLRLSNREDVKQLLSAKQYQTFLEETRGEA